MDETLALFASFYPRGRTVEELLAAVSLAEKRSAWVVNLSGGQRQRLAVACALVGDPELVFLDEPTTGLDPQSRRQLWEIVRELRARGRTIVLTTHYMDEAEKLCDRVAIVDQGQIIAQGSPAELIRSLGGDHVVEFAARGRAGGSRGVPGAAQRARRACRGRRAPAHRRRAARRDPGPAGAARAEGRDAGAPDDASREPRGRLRGADREAPAR